MVASGLSARQPPYLLPRAQTSCGPSGTSFVMSFRTGAEMSGAFVRGGCAGRDCGRRARGCSGGGAVRGFGGWAAGAGACVCGRRGSGAGCSGRRGGPTSSRASRAGACTICGSARRSGRGATGTDGAVGGPGAGGCWTVTQPERAVTATVTRSVAVVVVRCTRATMMRRARPGTADGRTLRRTGDLRPRGEGARFARVTFSRACPRCPACRSAVPAALPVPHRGSAAGW